MSEPKIKILIVDDSRTVRQLLKIVLMKGLPCQITEAEVAVTVEIRVRIGRRKP